MRERPILFSGPMVRAILEGQKTQTRRAVTPQPTDRDVLRIATVERTQDGKWAAYTTGLTRIGGAFSCPYGTVGNRLWVRETFAQMLVAVDGSLDERTYYAADGEGPKDYRGNALRWRPSIHMPRAVSRISLELTDVRVERLQAITNTDAIAEGCAGGAHVEGYSEANPADPYEEYAVLWDSINAKRGYAWDVNPFVWVLSFSVVEFPSTPRAAS